MEKGKLYALPELPYGYDALQPHISSEQLSIHHQKHHSAYVKGANGIFEKLEAARKAGQGIDAKSMLKAISFHIGGHVLHSLFWENLAPAGKGGGGMPRGMLGSAIDSEFGSFERFREEFSQAASSIEGSGWAALAFDLKSGRLLVMQIEKHNANIYPGFGILAVLDMWEHAFYIDYKNEKGKFIDAFWNTVNWGAAGKRLEALLE